MDRYRGSIRHTFDLWILNLFDAGRAKAHFESRQRSKCRPDSPSSNLSASTADCDGVRNVPRRDRWLPPLERTRVDCPNHSFRVPAICKCTALNSCMPIFDLSIDNKDAAPQARIGVTDIAGGHNRRPPLRGEVDSFAKVFDD